MEKFEKTILLSKMLNVVVVCGGTSKEWEISLKSGRVIYGALRKLGYSNITLFDLNDNIQELLSINPDIVFLALHGQGGEDGCIQGMLELANIPYTGSGVDTSAICMNKILTKQILSAANIPTAKFIEVRADEYRDKEELTEYLITQIGFPMVLKAPSQGSSIGVFIVDKKEDLLVAISEIFKFENILLAETFLDGIEITLPIIGNEEIIILPDIEITSENLFYDYQAKYTEGMCHHIIPARISVSEREQIRGIGEKVYRKLNCKGISRIDFIIDKKQGPMVIEVNTLPGMTEMSLVPDSGRAAGISFEKLCEKILEYGFRDKAKSNQKQGGH